MGAVKVGSPPRVRGKGAGAKPHLRSRGDHPRVCGEKRYYIICPDFVKGSPPRVRGKVLQLLDAVIGQGITPACAGKRHSTARKMRSARDHPRVCGEKTDTAPFTTSMVGSPPRVRGKVAIADQVFGCAGDHPRVCGEKRPLRPHRIALPGSPPRVRGKVFFIPILL